MPLKDRRFPLRSTLGRVTLQPFRSAEVPIVESWLEDRETCELAFGVKAPWNILSSIRTEYIEELQKDTTGVLSVKAVSPVLNSADADIIGFVRYNLFSKEKRRQARVGIILGPGASRGRGLGREAFGTLIDYLFSVREVTLIELDTAHFNTRARACFEACGFQVIKEMEFPSINAQWKERRLVMRLSLQAWHQAQVDSQKTSRG